MQNWMAMLLVSPGPELVARLALYAAMTSTMIYLALAAWVRMNQEREQACDGFAARLTGDPLAVASGLVKVGRMHRKRQLNDSRIWGEATSCAAAPGQLGRRVWRMVAAAQGNPEPGPRSGLVFLFQGVLGPVLVFC